MNNIDNNSNNDINKAKCILAALSVGISIFYVNPNVYAANSVVHNDTVPSGGIAITGIDASKSDLNPNGTGVSNIFQTGKNGVLTWNDFSIGANAVVNFNGPDNGSVFNTLNFVPRGNASQIYGTLNGKGGNIYVVNPAGVQIGKSAQINVGSLHISNRDLGDLNDLKGNQNPDIINDVMQRGKITNAELMSLGNINANKVTFEGSRVVLDTDRVRVKGKDSTEIITSDDGDVVLGHSYDKTPSNITVNGGDFKPYTYQWVKSLDDLQGMKNNQNYALLNSIDAIPTKDNSFDPIGDENNPFTGNFDGLNNNIFGLTINRANDDKVGLFGSTSGAAIKNVTLVNGSIKGSNSVGAIVGYADNTTIKNVINSAEVSGTSSSSYEVGGIVGHASNHTEITNAGNTASVTGLSYVGGIVGYASNTKVNGNSYNVGVIKASGKNGSGIGGLAGYAENSTFGNDDVKKGQIHNDMRVEGGYDVGGIVGTMSQNTTIQNAANSGTITVTSSISEGNAGGIAGSTDGGSIDTVINTGDVKSSFTDKNNNGKIDKDETYKAGNIGGIVGSATNTEIRNAENKENEVAGTSNIGGIAGTIDGTSTITDSINNGGDISGTGASSVETDDNSTNKAQIGNIGGIVGLMSGDSTYVKNASNRGNVHSVEDSRLKTANIGGIVGKLDGSNRTVKDMDTIKNDSSTAAISNSYNAGQVKGDAIVGGIVGNIKNAEIASSYNIGSVQSTRDPSKETSFVDVRLGGIAGKTSAVNIYDVYNKGTIGDKDFIYGARKVGGIVGNLSGNIDKAYNAGDIYNNITSTGGIVGYWAAGNITNVFNTGDITVHSKDNEGVGTQVGTRVGGIVGSDGWPAGEKTLSNAYNLGELKSYVDGNTAAKNTVGGIIGERVPDETGIDPLTVKNVYTTGEIYTDTGSEGVRSIVGGSTDTNLAIKNAYYIPPKDGSSVNLAPSSSSQTTDGQATVVTDKKILVHMAIYLTVIQIQKIQAQAIGAFTTVLPLLY